VVVNAPGKTVEIDPLLRPQDVASLLAVSMSWLAKARLKGDGPVFAKIGKAVRYRRSSVIEYIKSRTRTSTSEV
jgi:predicted DNA-binding transcriptional regulator AlpA